MSNVFKNSYKLVTLAFIPSLLSFAYNCKKKKTSLIIKTYLLLGFREKRLNNFNKQISSQFVLFVCDQCDIRTTKIANIIKYAEIPMTCKNGISYAKFDIFSV